MIVEPIEHDQERANTGRESKKPLFREHIRLQLTILERADGILHLLVVAVQGGKIKVRRGVGDIPILAIRTEEVLEMKISITTYHTVAGNGHHGCCTRAGVKWGTNRG